MEKLKNFKFIAMAMFVALLSMSLTACSDDDDNNVSANYAETIVGTWQVGSVNDGVVIEYKFKSNDTGEYSMKAYDDFGNETVSMGYNFTYRYIYNSETGYGTLAISDDSGTTRYKVQRFVNKLHIYSSTSSTTYTEYTKIK